MTFSHTEKQERQPIPEGQTILDLIAAGDDGRW